LLTAFPLPCFVSGEGGSAEGGSDGAAREGGNWNASLLMLIKYQLEISGHFVVSLNLCRALTVNNLALFFFCVVSAYVRSICKKETSVCIFGCFSVTVGFTSTIQVWRCFSTCPVCIAA
jgi:hypothetical protein